MGRPQAVNPKKLPLYDKLHTVKQKMYSGVEITVLHLIKETKEFYLSLECWAFCASKFKNKKKNIGELVVNVPIITNEKTINFLNEHAWKDWVEKESKSSEMIETIAFFDRLYPEKEKIYFYELESLVVDWCHGSFLSYDKDGNIEDADEHSLKRIKSKIRKYSRDLDLNSIEPIKKYYDAYKAIIRENKREVSEAYAKYARAEEDYLYEHHNINDVFIDLGQNFVVTPYAFTKGTADWHKEKYGKVCSYAHAGEIFFVVTPDAIFFQTNRHF